MRDADTSHISGRLLRVFITVYDEMSVSKAAERLNSSQSTVSHNLEKLRSIIGDRLFLPAGRGIVPSARAERLAPKIRRLLAQMDALLETGNYVPLGDPEPFVVATTGGILVPQVNTICNAIWQEIPAKHMIFRELGSRSSLEQLLERGEADVIITPRPASYPTSVRHAYLFSDTFKVFYDPQMRGPIRNVFEYSGAYHATLDLGGTAKGIVQAALDEYELSRSVTLSVPDVWSLAEVIRGSDTIATLPQMLEDSAFRGLACCDLPLNIAPAQFDLVWHKRFDDSTRLHWLRNKLISVLGKSAAAAA